MRSGELFMVKSAWALPVVGCQRVLFDLDLGRFSL